VADARVAADHARGRLEHAQQAAELAQDGE
jgi:hypothetical protein